MANMDFVTNDDLQKFKSDLLIEISKMFEIHFKPKVGKDYLTSEEVKERFGIKSVNTIKKYLTPKKFGNKNLYSVIDIENIVLNKV